MDRLPPGKPRKSLAIPANTPPADYKAYVEHPEVATLNQVMLHYLDMEEILKLYRQNHEQFETRQALDTLTQRFELPKARSFKKLLRNYDMQYATVRSYLYNNRTPEEILLDAALEGNIQAFYNQLKLYHALLDVGLYNVALEPAAEGGHEAIIELLFDLGAEDIDRTVLISAATGGQLTLVLKELAKGVENLYIEFAVSRAASNQHKDVVAALLDYRTGKKMLNEAMKGAGRSGDTTIIEYVISRGGNDYLTLINGAAVAGHFDIVKQYWNELNNSSARLTENILVSAVRHGNLDIVKFVIESKLIPKDQFEKSLANLKRKRRNLLVSKRTSKPHKLELIAKELATSDSIIAYLESKM